MSFDNRRNSVSFDHFARPSTKPRPDKRVKGQQLSTPQLPPRPDPSDLGRFFVRRDRLPLITPHTSIHDHLESILMNALESFNDFQLPYLDSSTLQVFRDHYIPTLHQVYTLSKQLSLESVLLVVYLIFRHSLVVQMDYSQVDFELLIVFLMISTKVHEVDPPTLDELMSLTFQAFSGEDLQCDPSTLAQTKQRIREKEALVLRQLGYQVNVPPFFFLLDYLIALECHPPRDSGLYTQQFFRALSTKPQDFFCRRNGLALAILELADSCTQTGGQPCAFPLDD